MRTYSTDLKKARRWLAAGRRIKTIRFLEPKVPLFLEDPEYYSILGRACLEAGLVKDADTYLNRGLQADPSHRDVRLALAASHLKRKDPAAAVRSWLEVLEDHPNNKYARKGLNTLRRISDPEAQEKFLNSFDPARYLPSLKSRWPGQIISVLCGLILFLCVLYFSDTVASALSGSFFSGRRPLPDWNVPSVSAAEEHPAASGNMDERESQQVFRTALRRFRAYDDNAVRYHLNRLLAESGAADIRLKAKSLLGTLQEPTIDNLGTAYSLAQVRENPAYYSGCFVLWRGMTANLEYGQDFINFDLLVGFESGTVLEGRVPVSVPFLTVMDPLPLELLAEVVVEEGGFTLRAKTLHFLR